jgi:hypothetical protein
MKKLYLLCLLTLSQSATEAMAVSPSDENCIAKASQAVFKVRSSSLTDGILTINEGSGFNLSHGDNQYVITASHVAHMPRFTVTKAVTKDLDSLPSVWVNNRNQLLDYVSAKVRLPGTGSLNHVATTDLFSGLTLWVIGWHQGNLTSFESTYLKSVTTISLTNKQSIRSILTVPPVPKGISGGALIICQKSEPLVVGMVRAVVSYRSDTSAYFTSSVPVSDILQDHD